MIRTRRVMMRGRRNMKGGGGGDGLWRDGWRRVRNRSGGGIGKGMVGGGECYS